MINLLGAQGLKFEVTGRDVFFFFLVKLFEIFRLRIEDAGSFK